MYNEDDYLQLSGLQHFLFCRRQWALIHVENLWQENYRTVDGTLMHQNVHHEGGVEKRGDRIIIRGMRVSSAVLGVSGQCDAVEFLKDLCLPKMNRAGSVEAYLKRMEALP